MFSKKNIEQIQSKGITVDQIEKQIEHFSKGFPALKLASEATIKNGIWKCTPQELSEYENFYIEHISFIDSIKFVPASGAATRMFKDLFAFKEILEFEKNKTDEQQEIDTAFIEQFFDNFRKFGFYNELKHHLHQKEKDVEQLLINKQYSTILDALLFTDGLNYGNLPKGLLKFHHYDGFSRTPFEEHLCEANFYCKQKNKIVNLHFTISEEHEALFKSHFKEILSKIEEKYQVDFEVNFSLQKPSTDTIAVTQDNTPFLAENGDLLFRPGGHGALLENLNDLGNKLIFIKNIDNVVPDHLKEDTIKYKKILGGILLKIRDQVFDMLLKLKNTKSTEDIFITECKTFIEKTLGYVFSNDFDKKNTAEKTSLIKDILNRPIRVCGMVKNSGEPGGGPFWIEHNDGSKSLQIMESSQINHSDPEQAKIFRKSTHFNPVDLVCYVYDYTGKKFDLLKFRDPQTGFISHKSKDGKPLKALEMPGLWNGSMAFWNTIFVEVPLITFNPVKTVNDLLRPEHQQETKTEQ